MEGRLYATSAGITPDELLSPQGKYSGFKEGFEFDFLTVHFSKAPACSCRY